jgi:hypothetical protein
VGVKVFASRELAREGEALAPGAAQRFGGIEFVRAPLGKFVMGSKDDKVKETRCLQSLAQHQLGVVFAAIHQIQ